MLKGFDYYQPDSVEEALKLGGNLGAEAEYIAGGTDVLVKRRNFDNAQTKHLISLSKLKHLAYIKEEESFLKIGALTTHRMLEKSSLILNKYPALYDAASQVGSVQIRNVGTIGGNICSSLPSADTSSPLIVLDAKVKIYSMSEGEKVLDIADFYIGPGKNILNNDEMVTEFLIPQAEPGSGSAYYKQARRKAMEIAVIGAAVYVSLDQDNNCNNVRIALTTAGPIPIKVNEAIKELIGKKVNEDNLYKTGKLAIKEAAPRSSFRGDAEYRSDVIPVLVKRAGLMAVERINY